MKSTFPITLAGAVIRDADEAKQKIDELQAVQKRLKDAVHRAAQKEVDPVVRMLNRRIARGETLYYEFEKYSEIVYREPSTRVASACFVQKRNGAIAVCPYPDQVERYAAIDRVYKLNLDGPSELLYERGGAL